MTQLPRALMLLASALAVSGCGLHGKPEIDRARPSSDAHPATRQGATPLAEPSRVVAPGVVEAWGGNIQLSPQESGWIAKISVNEGAPVKAGDVLAELDDEAQRAAVSLAGADLAEEEAKLAKALNGATREELRQARAEAEASQVRAALAEREAARSSRLGEVSAVAAAEVDEAGVDARVKSAIARGSQAKVDALERGARKEDRTAARSRVAAARARLELARASLSRRRVASPVSGVVLLSRFHAGEFFNVGSAPLFVLGETSKLQVRLEVDEIDAFRVSAGASCTLFGDDNRRLAAAAVFRLAPQMGRRGLALESPTARADIRVREVFVEVPNPDGLIPGQRVWGHVMPTLHQVALAGATRE